MDARSTIEWGIKNLIQLAGFEVEATVTQEVHNGQETIFVDLFGKDENFLASQRGQYIDAMHVWLKRLLNRKLGNVTVDLVIDSGGRLEHRQRQLEELAEKLKQMVLTRKRPVFSRPLPPKERRIIHQYLAKDGRVKTASVGEGHLKKIKIFIAEGTVVS